MEVYLGVDIGGTKTAAVLCDAEGRPLARAWIEHQPAGEDGLADRVIQAAQEVIREAPGHTPQAGGVAVAGLVSSDHRTVVHAATLGARLLPLADQLEAVLPYRLRIVNDANAALTAHLLAVAGDRPRSVVLLTIGTGLGGAVAVDGAVVHGAHGFAAELGHVTVDFQDPRRCLCGAPGCIENYASGRGLAEMATASGLGDAVTTGSFESRRIIEMAAEDGRARTLLEHAGAMLGRAITQLSTVLDPDEVIISGSVGHAAAEVLLPAARAEMAMRWPFPKARPFPSVRVDHIGPFAAAIGAAQLARLRHGSEVAHD